MSDFRKMMPFIFHFAAGVYGNDGEDLLLPPDRQFALARKRGWSDDPDDPGGATMIDVTLSAYRSYRRQKGLPAPMKEDLRNIPYAEWVEILKTMYWDRWCATEIESQGIANLLVDWVWASGSATIRKVQVMIGVKADGIVGQKTISALNKADVEIMFMRIFTERETYYRKCRGAWKYLGGWLRRLQAIRPDGSFLICGRIYK